MQYLKMFFFLSFYYNFLNICFGKYKKNKTQILNNYFEPVFINFSQSFNVLFCDFLHQIM